MNPVPTPGGGFFGSDHKGGEFDQRALEARNDVLVYSTGPLKEGVEAVVRFALLPTKLGSTPTSELPLTGDMDIRSGSSGAQWRVDAG
jgi:hypothetical protein